MKQVYSEISNIGWSFDNSYARLPSALFSKLGPEPVSSPELVFLNTPLSKKLGLDFSNINKKYLASLFSGNVLPDGAEPIAQAYAGHQFGYFTILGDGRALLLGEHVTKNNQRFDIQLKGSGKTPYSRQGDGRSPYGPVLREYIISEAMSFLRIPTTRSLAVVTTGEKILREGFLKSAILARVASSHVRVGTFEYAAAKKDVNTLRKLLEYVVVRHYPNILRSKHQAFDLLNEVIKKQVCLITDWMRVGFIHGVMNTDNMSLSGETIDYGPCAFMDSYNPKTFFSSIDQMGRYAFFNQPAIAQWNLLQLGKSLSLLIHNNQDKAFSLVKEAIEGFSVLFKDCWFEMMKKKLGIFGKSSEDKKIIISLLSCMEKNKLDYNNTFRDLILKTNLKHNNIEKKDELSAWLESWLGRLNINKQSISFSKKTMRESNPVIIPRNHKVEEAIGAATLEGRLGPIKDLLEALRSPYKEKSTFYDKYSMPPKDGGLKYKTFCGT